VNARYLLVVVLLAACSSGTGCTTVARLDKSEWTTERAVGVLDNALRRELSGWTPALPAYANETGWVVMHELSRETSTDGLRQYIQRTGLPKHIPYGDISSVEMRYEVLVGILTAGMFSPLWERKVEVKCLSGASYVYGDSPCDKQSYLWIWFPFWLFHTPYELDHPGCVSQAFEYLRTHAAGVSESRR
jgi:hypothetical protein